MSKLVREKQAKAKTFEGALSGGEEKGSLNSLWDSEYIDAQAENGGTAKAKKLSLKPKFKTIPTLQLTVIAVFSALAVALVALLHFPLIPAMPFLEYDAGDIPILIVTFMYGPVWGLFMTVVVSIIQGLTVSAASGWIGILMHIFSTGTFALIAGIIYNRNRTFKGAIIALIIGYLTYVGIMIVWNIIFTPIFTGVSREVLIKNMLGLIAAFNFAKGAINLTGTLVIYKSISRLIGSMSKSIAKKKVERDGRMRKKRSEKSELSMASASADLQNAGSDVGMYDADNVQAADRMTDRIADDALDAFNSGRIVYSSSADDTERAGSEFAAELRAGDIVLLNGELGAGKTTFTKGIASGLGITEEITSPTFTFLNIYSGGRIVLNHFDLYRIETEDEVAELGLLDTIYSGGVSVIEWNKLEKLQGRIFMVNISYRGVDEKRIIEIRRK